MKINLKILTPIQKAVLIACLKADKGRGVRVSLRDGFCLLLNFDDGDFTIADCNIDGDCVNALEEFGLLTGPHNPHSDIFWYLTEEGKCVAKELLSSK